MAEEFIKNVLEKNKIVLFMKGTPEQPQCGFSNIASTILKKENADFVAINVLEDTSIREGIKEFSNWPTIPQLYVNKKFIGGADIMREMHENGEIKDVLNK